MYAIEAIESMVFPLMGLISGFEADNLPIEWSQKLVRPLAIAGKTLDNFGDNPHLRIKQYSSVIIVVAGGMWRQNKMMTKEYFHLCSDGSETPDFITSRKDFIAAMNIVALCAANTDVVLVAFTIEDTHLHLLIYAIREECVKFKVMFEKVYTRYAAKREEKGTPFSLEIEIFETGNDEDYVRNIAAYTVIQPTKDGKGILPFDYEWGSGSLYFRSGKIPLLWLCSEGRIVHEPIRFGRMTIDKQRETVHSRTLTIPADWLVCDGIVLPTNYVNVVMFEGLFRTHNRYRVFLSSSSVKDAEILNRMARERGVMLDDLEARALCGQECKLMFGIRDPRRI